MGLFQHIVNEGKNVLSYDEVEKILENKPETTQLLMHKRASLSAFSQSLYSCGRCFISISTLKVFLCVFLNDCTVQVHPFSLAISHYLTNQSQRI